MNSNVSWNVVCPCQIEGQRVWGHLLLCGYPHPNHRKTDAWSRPADPRLQRTSTLTENYSEQTEPGPIAYKYGE